MTKITTLKPKQTKADQLNIDIVVKLASGLHRITELKYGRNELYIIPTTHRKGEIGIDLKTSYHGSGEIHGKLTRGKLRQATAKFEDGKAEPPQIDTLGEATPTDKDTEILLWKEQGTPLNSIKGVVEINPTQQGVQHMTNIAAVAETYPILHKSDADYVFGIDTQSVQWIDIKYFFVEPGNTDTLEECIKELIDSYNNVKSKSNRLAHKFKSLEKAVLFNNMNPWLAIVLFKFSEKAKGSESALNGGR